jgi:hypothetical protein
MQSQMLIAMLRDLRQHPAYPELLKALPRPQLRRFRISQAQEAEKARAEWIYLSGQAEQHDKWLALLTGQAPEPLQQETK